MNVTMDLIFICGLMDRYTHKNAASAKIVILVLFSKICQEEQVQRFYLLILIYSLSLRVLKLHLIMFTQLY